MSAVELSLVIAECEPAIRQCTGDLKDRLRVAMEKAKDHWMVMDRDVQLRGAIGAVMLHYGKDSDEYKRITYEVDAIKRFSALINAAQNGLNVSLADVSTDETPPEPIGIMGMWREIAK